MPLPRDDDGEVQITVADLIAYLSTLPPTANVGVDKDGWMEEDTSRWLSKKEGTQREASIQEVIEHRGLFQYDKRWGLCINN